MNSFRTKWLQEEAAAQCAHKSPLGGSVPFSISDAVLWKELVKKLSFLHRHSHQAPLVTGRLGASSGIKITALVGNETSSSLSSSKRCCQRGNFNSNLYYPHTVSGLLLD